MMQSSRADDCIEAVVERYKKMVFGIALSHTGNRTDADDVFQEVFLIYFRKNNFFNEEEHRKAWLITTTINCSKKVIYNNWKKKIVSLSPELKADSVFRTDEQNLVFSALSTLPQKYRIVLHLFYFEEMTVAEIAKTLNIKEGTVKVQMLRGREQMRQKLKGDYFYE